MQWTSVWTHVFANWVVGISKIVRDIEEGID
jgi:hypothetical protein